MFRKADAGRYNKMTADIVECSEVDADLVMLLNALCIGLYCIHCVLCCRQDRI